MPTVYRTASFSVRPEALMAAKRAINDFVVAVNSKEPGTRLYLSLQSKEDPSRFVHVMAFDDDQAEELHRGSKWVKEFTEVLYPLTNDGVQFTACGAIGYELPSRNGVKKKPAKAAKPKKKKR